MTSFHWIRISCIAMCTAAFVATTTTDSSSISLAVETSPSEATPAITETMLDTAEMTTAHETTVNTTLSTEATSYGDNGTTMGSNVTSTTTGPREKSYKEYTEAKVAKFLLNNYNYFTNIPGMLGNFLTIITAAQMKPYTATSICIMTLATTDFCMCAMRNIYFYIKLKVFNAAYCNTKQFMLAFFSYASNYILVVWTLERLIAVAFPMKLQIWCTVKNTKIALALAVLISLAFSVAFITESDVEVLVADETTTITQCTWSVLMVEVYGYVDFVFYVLVPMVVILTSNTLIMIIMSKRRKAHANMTNNVETQEKRLAEQRRMTYILLSVSFAFVILHVPYLVKTGYDIHFFLNPFKFGQYFYAKYWLMGVLCSVWLQYQNVVNFIIYCLSGPRFRGEFLKIFCFCLRKTTKKTDRVASTSDTRLTSVSVISSKSG